MYVCSFYHSSFLIEDAVSHAFWSHPFEGQFDVVILALSEVACGVHIFRETKISNLHIPLPIQPGKQVKFLLKSPRAQLSLLYVQHTACVVAMCR